MSRAKPYVIGLTGSIGMGKSTTALMFQDEDAAVWDADAAVHRLYEKGGAAVDAIGEICAGAVINDAVSRATLKKWIAADDTALAQIESVVHPLVARDRASFLRETDADIVVLDIPLLLETGSANKTDMIVVVSAPPGIQRARVLARPGMTKDQFRTILDKQMPDAEKRALAEVVISTETLEGARLAVQSLVRKIRKEIADA